MSKVSELVERREVLQFNLEQLRKVNFEARTALPPKIGVPVQTAKPFHPAYVDIPVADLAGYLKATILDHEAEISEIDRRLAAAERAIA